MDAVGAPSSTSSEAGNGTHRVVNSHRYLRLSGNIRVPVNRPEQTEIARLVYRCLRLIASVDHPLTFVYCPRSGRVYNRQLVGLLISAGWRKAFVAEVSRDVSPCKFVLLSNPLGGIRVRPGFSREVEWQSARLRWCAGV